MKFYKGVFILIGFLLISQVCFGYTGGPQNGIDIGQNARAINRMNFQVGTGSTFVMRYGTTTVTGSGTAGYMMGTDTAYPRWVWTPATGRMNFLDITLQQNGVDIAAYGNSAALAAALSDETGTNTAVFSSSPTITNPTFTSSSNFPLGIWNSSGNVGIGTTTLYGGVQPPTLSIMASTVLSGTDGGQIYIQSPLNKEKGMRIGYDTTNDFGFIAPVWGGAGYKNLALTPNGGYVGIGTTNPLSKLHINDGTNYNLRVRQLSGFVDVWVGKDDASDYMPLQFDASKFYFNNGNVGIGTTTPSAQLHTTGGVRFATLGSGAVQSDASGNLSVSSDERLKDTQGDFTAGLSELLGINPILYKFNKLSGLETENTYAGFSAQNVMKYIPEAVGQDGKGYYTLNDRPIVAALVNCVKKLQEEIEALQKINNVEGKITKATPITKPNLVYTKDICLNDVEYPDAVDTHEYIEEGTEDDWLGISKEDAFETIAICENIQTGTETTYFYKLEGTESVRVCAEKPVYTKIETEKTEIKLKQDVSFDPENGMFYQKLSVPKLVYKLKPDYSYKDGKYYRKETVKEAKTRMGRE